MLTLSPLGQSLFFFTRSAKHGIVPIDIFKSLQLCGESTLKVILSRLLKKGALIKLKNGLYSWNVEGGGVEDFFYASQATYDGYLGFSTALYLHGLTDQYPFTLFVVTPNKSASKRIGDVELKAVAMHKRAIGTHQLGDYLVSTVPKTLYDCFHLPEYSGGLSVILRAVYEAKLNESQWREFLTYVDKFESQASKKKIGAYLNLLKETDRPVPAWVVSQLGKANLKLDKNELLSWWFA